MKYIKDHLETLKQRIAGIESHIYKEQGQLAVLNDERMRLQSAIDKEEMEKKNAK